MGLDVAAHDPRFPPAKRQAVDTVNYGAPEQLKGVGIAGKGEDADLCVGRF